MKKIKILSWIPIVGTYYADNALYYAVFTKKFLYFVEYTIL